jgi:hypothetical protein
MLGDFNSVRDSSERRGVGHNASGGLSPEMVDFNSFLANLELEDLPLIGRAFTWFHPNGVAMSRLDRMLISNSWFDVWGAPNVWVLMRDVADHCLLVLKYNSSDWGPKPFCFNNFLLQHRDFKELVSNAWGEVEISGWMCFVLKEKLKRLKVVIKEWNVATLRGSKRDKQRLIDDISALRRKKLFDDLWHLLK